MTIHRKTLSLIVGLALTTSNISTQAESIYTEQGKLIRAPEAIGSLGTDLFGDKVNLYTGTLEFVQTDVSLPGNNTLPVSVGRRLVTGTELTSDGLFGMWDLEIPHLHGVFAADVGWTVNSGGTTSTQRCTNFGKPPMASGSFGSDSWWAANEYWHGSFLYIPGLGDQEILRRNVPANANVPSDGQSWPLVTRNQWSIRCLPSLISVSTASGGKENGEGFLAIAPDGTQYRFDWLASRAMSPLEKSSPAPQTIQSPSSGTLSATQSASQPTTTGKTKPGKKGGGTVTPSIVDGNVLARSEIWILPTQVTDRFGNTVTYTYDTTDKWKLLSIQSSDGRKLSFTHVPDTHHIASVSDGTRTWNYTYGGTSYPTTQSLNQVIQPDGSVWQLAGADDLVVSIDYVEPPTCDTAGVLNAYTVTGTMTHPSGATGKFALQPIAHGRSWVDQACRGDVLQGTSYALYPRYFGTFGLTSKTISGPGLPTLTWAYSYGAVNSSWNPCSTCTVTDEIKTVSVTDPQGDITRYTFGNKFRVTEGQLQTVESGLSGNVALRTARTHYRAPDAGPYPNPIGYSDQPRGDSELSTRFTPVDQRVVTQQGTDFTWQANVFDPMARATSVTRSSSLGNSRTETTVYKDQLTKWILGQVSSVTESSTGAVMVANQYDDVTATLLSTSHFGHLDQSMTYNADGTLATRKDGRNQSTTYTNYYRGLAQNVAYADGKTESAVVNDIGLIRSTTDAAGFPVSYGYDAIGRLNLITRPGWNDTSILFEPVGTPEYDIPAGHWRQTVSTGTARTITYVDGLWRPQLTRRYDSANEAGTSSMISRSFDTYGRTTFESYPQRSITSVLTAVAGTKKSYDALGRKTSITADSELGGLTTATEYLAGFQKRITNPRGQVTTTTRFQAFDEPAETAPLSIAAPEGVAVTIARDVFDKPTSIVRSGNGYSATRSYVYDGSQRLCKTIEPETGATVQDYDAANNTAWRAAGLSLPSLICDRSSVPATSKISYGYDNRNRLIQTSYSDGSPGITRTYTADGLLNTISSGSATWTTSYNDRRLPIQESLNLDGVVYNLNWAYDGNGRVNQLTYPDGKSIVYSPNAFGEASQVGSYASNISYFPNGAVAGFTYGNGIVHTLTQNARGLPLQSKDAGILQDQYAYDANSNVASITDQQEGVTTRTLGYDGLDRLTSAAAAGVWGTASYTYDTLDNLRSSVIGARNNVYFYDATNRLTSLSSSASNYNYSYSYDAQGNITQRGVQGFTFDQGNRLGSATGKATYSYDGLGHRVKINGDDGTRSIQVYSQAGQLLYATQSGGPNPASKTKYIYLNRHLIAEVSQ